MTQLVHQFVKGGLLCLQGSLQLRQAFFLLRQGFFGACAQVLLLSGDQLHGLMHIREPGVIGLLFFGKQRRDAGKQGRFAEYGPFLPHGLQVELPDIPTTTTVQTVQLWD